MGFYDELVNAGIKINNSESIFQDIDNSGEGTVFVSVNNPNIELSVSHILGDTYINSVINDKGQDLYTDVGGAEIGSLDDVKAFINENFSDGYVKFADIGEKIDLEVYKKEVVNENSEVTLEQGESSLSADEWEADFKDDYYSSVFELEYEEDDNYNNYLEYLQNYGENVENTITDDALYDEGYDFPFEEIGALDDNIAETDNTEVLKAIEIRDLTEEKLSQITDKVSESYKSAIFESGYIPPVMRESKNPSGNSQITIFKETINEIRKDMPDFGKMIGGTVDTQSKHMLWPVRLEHVKPYLKEDTDKIKGCRVYVDHGEPFRVDIGSGKDKVNITNYHPVNVYTFEFTMDKGPKQYTVLVGNDLGHIYRELPIMGDSIPMLINSDKYDFLDKTNINAPEHFKRIEAVETDTKGHIIRDDNNRPISIKDENGNPVSVSNDVLDAIRNALENANDDYLEKISDKIVSKLEDKRSVIEERINISSEIETEIRNTYDNAEFLKEYYGAEIETKINELDTIADSVTDTLKKLDSIENRKTSEYKALVNDVEKLKQEYYEKLELITDASSACDVGNSDKTSYFDIAKVTADNKEVFEKTLDIKESYENYYDLIYTDDENEGLKGGKDDTETTKEGRFCHLLDSSIPQIYKNPVDSDKISNVLSSKAIEIKEKLVDEWNSDSKNEKMKLSLDKISGEIWTPYGTRVEIEKIQGETVYFNYDKMSKVIDINATSLFQKKDGSFEKESVCEYLKEKVDGTDVKIEDIGKLFIENTLRRGISKDSIGKLEKGILDNVGDRLEHKILNAGISDIEPVKDIIDTIDTKRHDEKKDIEIKNEAPYVIKNEALSKNDVDRIAKSAASSTAGQINKDRDIGLSDAKIQELKAYGDKAADDKKAEILDKLAALKGEILKSHEKMEKFDTYPPSLRNRNTFFTVERLKFDKLIREYENIGGKVEKGSFVEKGVSAKDIFAGSVSFLQSNLIETVVIEGLFKIFDAIENVKNDVSKIEIDKEKHTDTVEKEDKMVEKSESMSDDISKTDKEDTTEREINEVDKTEEDADDTEKSEEDTEKADKTEEDADNIDKPEEDTDKVDKTEEDADEADKPEEDTEKVDKTEEDADEADKPEEDTEKVDKTEEDADNIEKPEEDTEKADKTEEDADDVDKLEEDTEKADKAEEDADDTDKPEEDTEKADKTEEDADDTDKPEEDTEKADKTEEDADDADKPEEDTDKADKTEEDIDDADKPEEDKADKENTDDVDKSEDAEETDKTEEDAFNETNDTLEEDTEELADSVDKSDKNSEKRGTSNEERSEDLNNKITSKDIAVMSEDELESDLHIAENDYDPAETQSNNIPRENNDDEWGKNIKEKISDYFEEKDDFKETMVESLIDDFSPEDLIDAACESLFDIHTQSEDYNSYIESAGEVINYIADITDGIPSDIRDTMYEKLEDLGMTEGNINDIENTIAYTVENSDSNFISANYGEVDNVFFDELGIIENNLINDLSLDNQLNDVESQISDYISDDEFMNEVTADVIQMDIADQMKNDLINEGIDCNAANDLVENQIINDISNNVDINTDTYIDDTVQNIMNQHMEDDYVDLQQEPNQDFQNDMDTMELDVDLSEANIGDYDEISAESLNVEMETLIGG